MIRRKLRRHERAIRITIAAMNGNRISIRWIKMVYGVSHATAVRDMRSLRDALPMRQVKNDAPSDHGEKYRWAIKR